MNATAEASAKLTSSPQQRPIRKISWSEFQRKYLSREDGYKYEWLNGVVEKSKRGMDKTQLYILRTIQRHFRAKLQEGVVFGELVSEPDLFFLEHHRRPDVAWLTDEEIDRLTYDSKDVPAFVIEVISTNDQINRVERKMDDYRAAGVQVVWNVFPQLGKVHVYAGEKLNRMEVLEGVQICSAMPVLEGFEISVEELLRKPEIKNP